MVTDISNFDKWVIATDSTNVFHLVFASPFSQFTTGLPYVIIGDTEEEVLSKVFADSELYDPEGEPPVLIGDLTAKSQGDIIAQKY
jgi:hypothetical protein